MKKHIVLYNPRPSKEETQTDVSLALLSVASIPYSQGYPIKYVNSSNKNAREKVMQLSESALCIGFTVMTGYQVKDAIDMTRKIKAKYPEAVIIWGGWHPSILPEQTIKDKNIDIVVIGQGQRTFAEIVEALNNGKPLNCIKGIIYKEGGNIIKTEQRPFEDINNFPPLPYEIVESEQELFANSETPGERVIFYYTSQGCPHRCKFCADPLVYKHRITMLSAERVVADIERFVKKYNITGVHCVDTNFWVSEKRIQDICHLLLDKGINIKWVGLNGRTNHLLKMSDKTWGLLKKTNLTSILVGAESGSEDTMKYLQKDATVRDTIELTKKCKQYGVKIRYSFLLGLPPNPDSKEPYSKQIKNEWNALVKFIDETLAITKENAFNPNVYTPYPGTAFDEICRKNGYKEPETLDGWANYTLDKGGFTWLPKKYISLMSQVRFLYLPFLTGEVYKKFNKYGPAGKFARFFLPIMHAIIIFRWKTKFYSFPIEYYIFKNSKQFARKCILKRDYGKNH